MLCSQHVQESSTVWLRDTRSSGGDGGGIFVRGVLRLKNASLHILDSMADKGGGFFCQGLDLTASTLDVQLTSAQSSGGAFLVSFTGSRGSTAARIIGSRITIASCSAGTVGGGFIISGIRDTGKFQLARSQLRLSNVTAGQIAGGFEVDSLQMQASELQLEDATSANVGGFHSFKGILIIRSNISLANTAASGESGGFHTGSSLEVTSFSSVKIVNSTASHCGGFQALARVLIADSVLRVDKSTASTAGGAVCAANDVLIVRGSKLFVSHSQALSGSGGALEVLGSLQVSDNSTVSLNGCWASSRGGGAHVRRSIVVAGRSSVAISATGAAEKGGGLATGNLRLTNQSRLNLETVSAEEGGGVYALGEVIVEDRSVSSVLTSAAIAGRGGAFSVSGKLEVASNSTLEIRNATARVDGGGIDARYLNIRNHSLLIFSGNIAGRDGGAFYVGGAQLSDSDMLIEECRAQVDGGGIWAMLVWLKHSRVSIASRALDRGGGIFAQSIEAVDSELLVSGGLAPVADAMLGSGAFLQGPLRLVRSTMRLQDLQGESGLVSRCMELDNSTLSLDSDAGQGLNKGIALQNAGCTCHAALQIHGGIRAVGVNSALFSVDACGNETLHVSHVHLQALHAAVAEARAHTALSNVTVEYLQPLQPVHDGMAPLVVAPSFEAQSVEISCQSCGPNGVTFAADGGKLSAVSSRSLRCDAKASLVEGSTALCTCVGQQVADPSYGQAVQASEALNYCIYCPPQFEAIDGECQKCPLHKAISKG